MFKILATVDKYDASNILSVKRHQSGLNIRLARLKIRFLIISKLLIISSNCGLRSSARQARIALRSF